MDSENENGMCIPPPIPSYQFRKKFWLLLNFQICFYHKNESDKFIFENLFRDFLISNEYRNGK